MMPTVIPQWTTVGDHVAPERCFVSEVREDGAACLQFPLTRSQGEMLVALLNANPDRSIRFKQWCTGQARDETLAEIMSWLIQEGVFTA